MGVTTMPNDNKTPDSIKTFEAEALEQYNKVMAENARETKEDLEEEVYNETPPEDGGPTDADIGLWKKQYPDSNIYRVVIVDNEFIFRTLIRGEYKVIAANATLNALSREEVICRTCCLYPILDAETIGRSDAGTISTLAKTVMEFSGFVEPETVVRLA